MYGTGEVAEIGFVLLQDRPLRVVAVVGDDPRPTFSGRPVQRVEDIAGLRIGSEPFDRVVLMTLDDVELVRQRLIARGVPVGAITSIA